MMDRTMPDEIVVPRHGYAHDRLACPAENIKHEMHELNFENSTLESQHKKTHAKGKLPHNASRLDRYAAGASHDLHCSTRSAERCHASPVMMMFITIFAGD